MPITVTHLARHLPAGALLYPSSVQPQDDCTVALMRSPAGKQLLLWADAAHGLPSSFAGEDHTAADVAWRVCPLAHEQAVALRQCFPWTAPRSLRALPATLGCCDRLGRATPGHIRAVRGTAVAPVLAQQSIRELTLTGRTYDQVVDDVTFLVFQEGYQDGFGADGDHLKTLADIDRALDAGMTMITLDLSEVMLAAAQGWDAAQVDSAFAALPEQVRQYVLDTYADRTFAVAESSIAFAPLEARRCAVMYLRALDFAQEVWEHLRRRRGDGFDFELSIDETTAPTLPPHHLFIVRELSRRGVRVTSLAPRFIGEFQKGIDYIGDLNEFARQFRLHCDIARSHGDYKISIHSGSDKFAVFPIIGRETHGRVHVKTAGTSWLEAVRAMAQVDPGLYRSMHARALATFSDAKKLYHVTTDLGRSPALATVGDAARPQLMERSEARQLLHITYGGILSDAALRSRFFTTLDREEEAYYATLQRHFTHHLVTLGFAEPTR